MDIRKKQSVVRSATSLIALTVLVKLIGFIKQIVISYSFGTSLPMDLYLIVTGFVSEIGVMFFASIAINVLSIYNEKKQVASESNRFISNTITVLLALSVFLVILVDLFAGPITKLLAPGFDEQQLITAAGKLRLVSFLLLNICISNVCIAVLNAEKDFNIAKSIGIIQSVLIIAACLLLRKTMGIRAMYLSFIVYYLIENVFLLWRTANYVKFKPFQAFRDRDVLNLVRLSIPLFVSNAVIQINAMVDKAIASGLEEGSVSALSYGSFIFSTIHSVIIASVTTVLISFFSQYVIEKNNEMIVQKARNSIILLIGLLIPVTIVSAFNAEDIIRVIYARGSFGEDAVRMTSLAFLGFSFGIIFIAISDVFLQILYAYKDTKGAMICGVIAVAINVVLSITLSKFLGILGIAVADSVAYLAMTLLRAFRASKSNPGVIRSFRGREIIKLLVCAALGIAVCVLCNACFARTIYILKLIVAGMATVIVFGGAGILLKCSFVQEIKSLIKKNG